MNECFTLWNMKGCLLLKPMKHNEGFQRSDDSNESCVSCDLCPCRNGMRGITGEIYKQFGVTLSCAVVRSTFTAFTLSQAMCTYLLNDIEPKTIDPLACSTSRSNSAQTDS